MFAVVMAGGAGTRFWPASSERLPKQFLKVVGEQSLLAQTLDRIRPLVPDERVFIVVNRSHIEPTSDTVKGRAANILAEPIGRNTAACIGLAALHIARVSPDDPMVVLPADHFIRDDEGFRAGVSAAVEIAKSGALVTIGVSPDRPETGFGYIETGDIAGEALGEDFFRVVKFVEKPPLEKALEYVAGGRHLWNSGIFVFTAKTILREIELLAPTLHEGLAEIDRAIGAPDYDEVLSAVYPRLEAISIDYAVMEKTTAPVHALKSDFGWSDVGSWEAVYHLHADKCDAEGNVLLGTGIIADSRGNLLYSTMDRPVAFVGVEGLTVVDTADGLLVARLDRSQDVKHVPSLLKARGR